MLAHWVIICVQRLTFDDRACECDTQKVHNFCVDRSRAATDELHVSTKSSLDLGRLLRTIFNTEDSLPHTFLNTTLSQNA